MPSMLFTLTIFRSSRLEREPLSLLSNTLKVHRSLSSSFPRRTRLIAATYSKKSIFWSCKHEDDIIQSPIGHALGETNRFVLITTMCRYSDGDVSLRSSFTHVIHVKRSEDVVHVLGLRGTVPHAKHPLELVQVQRSARALQNEGPVKVLDAAQLQFFCRCLWLLILAHF